MKSRQPAVSSRQWFAACGFAVAPLASAVDSDPIIRAAHGSSSSPGAFSSVQVGLALLAVLALIALLKWCAGKFLGVGAKSKSSSSIKVISRNVLSPKQSLMLVQVGRRVVLVGDSGNQMNALSEITDADEVAELVGSSNRRSADEAEFAGVIESAEKDFSADAPAQDADVEKMQNELSGLAERVRGLSRAFQKA